MHTISVTGQIVCENVVSDLWADRQSNSDRFEGEADGDIDAEGTDPGSDRFNPVIRRKRRRNHSKQESTRTYSNCLSQPVGTTINSSSSSSRPTTIPATIQPRPTPSRTANTAKATGNLQGSGKRGTNSFRRPLLIGRGQTNGWSAASKYFSINASKLPLIRKSIYCIDNVGSEVTCADMESFVRGGSACV